MEIMYNIMSFPALSRTVQHLSCDSFDELIFPSMTLLSAALRIMLLVLFLMLCCLHFTLCLIHDTVTDPLSSIYQ